MAYDFLKSYLIFLTFGKKKDISQYIFSCKIYVEQGPTFLIAKSGLLRLHEFDSVQLLNEMRCKNYLEVKRSTSFK